ncbi:hypothetical protein VKT23_014904 [Stygiomarasmius scandens]|uniref:NmrA-like domain-containing protein n=1 Tax=Marasmiellus scandens TaxID=2682957 RepID=A0ABR1IZI7_9AGAR
MSNYKVFAVAGLGRIGINIARELLSIQKGDHGRIEAVHLLTQSASKLSNEIRAELIGEGAHLHTVNYTSPTSVSDALQGVDVLISAIGYRGLSSQEALCDRAKEARVKLFVPSEYGARSDDMKDPLFAIKELFRQKLIANGIKFAAFYSGFWADFDLDPYVLVPSSINVAKLQY